MMNGHGKSDSPVIPAKSSNKAEGPTVEATEVRGLAKGNSPERNAFRTQGREDAPRALERVRQAATRDKKQRVTALFHHIYDVDRLRAAFYATKKDAAAGVDGETWEHYVENLEAKLQDLSHEHRIADRRVLRLIQKWLKAGVREEGRQVQSEIGTVQGGSISPLRSNIYLHYVLDLWVQRGRKKQAHGEVILVRFADDFVAGFQHRHEAERFLAELRQRLARFGLPLHADKTRIVEFGRYAEHNRRNRGDGKPETFNFLGFTHSCGKTRKGHFTVRRHTMRPRWQAKLRALKEELRRRLHTPIREQGVYLRSVLLGHFRYYGVPMNGPALGAFRQAVGYLGRTVLRRRSQGNHMPWHRVWRYIKRWFPPAKVGHPYPLVRLGVVTQGGSRMR